MKKNFVRIFALVLAAVLVLGVVAMGIVAMAATPDTLYFKPSEDWKTADARFAAYFFGNGEAWDSVIDSDGDGIYECTVPAGMTSVIFVRMDPNKTANNWDSKWNQTADLSIPTDGKNYFTLNAGEWDGAQGTWSTIEIENACTHDWGTGSVTTAATCEKNGVKTYTCSLCGNTKNESIIALGHNYVDGTCDRCGDVQAASRVIYFVNTENWSVVNAYAWNSTSNESFLGTWPGTAMNKVEDNLYSITVSGEATHIIFNNGSAQTADLELSTENNCYDYSNGWEYLDNCEHTYDNGTVTTAPTCTNEGEKTFTCTKCGHTYTEVVDALGHMYSNGTCLLCGEAEPCDHLWDNGSTTTAATCTENGVKTYTCRKCSETKTEVITATGHKYLDGVCYNCGEKEPTVDYVDIATVADLIAFANRVNAGETTLNGRLVANIDLKGASWSPIGIYCPDGDTTKSVFYRGIFNGNGYTVSNFTVSGTDCVGLFGYAEMATIMNLGVINATMTGWNAGAICGYAPTATIINCYAIGCNITGNTTNPIAINSEAVHVGAIAGSNAGTVKNCYAVNCTLSTKFVGQFNSMSPLGGVICSNNYYSNVSGAFTNTNGATSVTAAQLASGEVAYKLADAAWGQEIGKDAYPVIFGKTVYFENGTYFNESGDVHKHSYKAVVTAPTCTAEGYTTYTCSCGDSYVSNKVPALGHASYTYAYDKTAATHNFTCTLCGETVTKAAEAKFAFNTASPALAVDIVMNIATTIPAGFEKPYMVVEFNGTTTTLTEYTINETNGRYVFAFPGINPQIMGDTFVATLYAYVDGIQVSVNLEYSMLKYLDSQLKKLTEASTLRTALSDLVMYGDANQVYEGYKTDALLSTLLSDASKANLDPSTFPGLDESYNKQVTAGVKDANIDLKGVTMALGSKIMVRMTVFCADAAAYTVKVTINGEDFLYPVSELALAAGYTDRYVVEFDQIRATQFGEEITFSFLDADGNQVGRTLTYTVYTYVQKNQAADNENLVNLLKAIYNYGESVKNI